MSDVSNDSKSIEDISILEAFISKLKAYHVTRDSKIRNDTRRSINQDKSYVRELVIAAGCFQTLTITPPPAVGGLIQRNVDPFDVIFDAPYGVNVSAMIVDAIDETIGVLRRGGKPSRLRHTPVTTADNVRHDFAFVAMAMDSELPELADVLDAIKEAAADCSIQAERIDDNESSERITDRIIQLISTANFVVVDLTYPRPNVYFEAGYAHGLGKIPIYIARDGTKIEFDVKDYPVIFFKNFRELKASLKKRLLAVAARPHE